MIVSGLTIVRNAIRLDYPFAEAIRSALPLCDEYVVVVGQSDDGTIDAVRALDDSRIRIVETVWSQKLRPKDHVLSQQTNIGLHMCRGDWVICLQANEVLHETSGPILLEMMKEHCDNPVVEALLLERLTFWGDYRHILGVYPHRFKFSPRIVRPEIGTYFIRDAMSCAVFDGFSRRGRYPRAMDTGQDVFRYGYVGTPDQLRRKTRESVHLQDKAIPSIDEDHFYRSMPRQFVRRFDHSHPQTMRSRIEGFGYALADDDPRWRTDLTWKERQRLFETGLYARFGVPRFRNKRYSLVGRYKKKKPGPHISDSV